MHIAVTIKTKRNSLVIIQNFTNCSHKSVIGSSSWIIIRIQLDIINKNLLQNMLNELISFFKALTSFCEQLLDSSHNDQAIFFVLIIRNFIICSHQSVAGLKSKYNRMLSIKNCCRLS